jgi:UDP-N-acetylmuramoyl-tripeptide--D-alanyl-D-alanine ligase
VKLALAKVRNWPRSRQALAAAALVLLLGAVAWWRFGEHFYVRWLLESPSSGRCQKRLNRDVLSRSIKLGTDFLLVHQKRAGNFDYEYDWQTHKLSGEDQETRQAGALWGLTLLYQDDQRPELAAAIERGLSYFDAHSLLVKGTRCTTYPGSDVGRIGTVALVALSHIEYLRAARELPSDQRELLDQRLNEYLRLLMQSILPSGVWPGDYELTKCSAQGDPSSYFDGEALLALVKAAKYLGRAELLPTIMLAAAGGKHMNIDEPLAEEADSDVTKGYYQWSSMAFYELATSDFANTKVYGDTLLELADWVIDTHHILTRNRNTGYAYEGIVHAYAFAKRRGDAPRTAKYACVIDLGLEHLLSWQVGGPLANRFARAVSPADSKGIGGVQNEAFDAGLRIDVTQHQLHALQLARQYVY